MYQHVFSFRNKTISPLKKFHAIFFSNLKYDGLAVRSILAPLQGYLSLFEVHSTDMYIVKKNFQYLVYPFLINTNGLADVLNVGISNNKIDGSEHPQQKCRENGHLKVIQDAKLLRKNDAKYPSYIVPFSLGVVYSSYHTYLPKPPSL